MIRFLLSAAFAVSIATCSFSQHKVEGTISGFLNKQMLLLEYFGDKHRVVDSTRTDGNGWFSFEINQGTPNGLYSLATENSPLFNFIYNEENILIKFDPSAFKPPEFIESIENLVYYDYLVNKDLFEQKAAMIIDILRYYPEQDSFSLFADRHYMNLQSDFEDYTNLLIKEYPATLASHIIYSDRPVRYPDDMHWKNYTSFNQKHFLDNVDFSDTILINTDVFTSKAIDYLAFYSVNSQSKELQEEFFIQAVDTILHKAMASPLVYDFLMQYLIEGFEMYGFDRVISHIALNYEPANTCINEDRKSELEKRVENLRSLAIGNTAPDIEFESGDMGNFSLSDVNSDRIVVLFWASWCPHCNQMIPYLKEVYEDKNMPDFEVIAIALDTNATSYNQSLAEHAAGWINYTDLNGWNSKPAIDYSIYATPTMFLLDQNRKILARPVTVTDLRNALLK
jgi:thiol-disulfide isomerase/thioredoxin